MPFGKPNERFRASGQVDKSAALFRVDGAEAGGDNVAKMGAGRRVAPSVNSQGNRSAGMIEGDPARFPDRDFFQDLGDWHQSA